VAAYEELRPELRDLADRLWALHTNTYDYAAVHADARSEDQEHYDRIFTATVYETEHPVVRVHPETGERSLVLGNFVQKLIGYSKTDSAHLFNLFQSHITRPENTVRWRWQAGRCCHLGQPGDPALRPQRLWRPAAHRPPRNRGRRRAHQRRRTPQRGAEAGPGRPARAGCGRVGVGGRGAVGRPPLFRPCESRLSAPEIGL